MATDSQPGSNLGSTRFGPVFQIQSQLLAEEKTLGGQSTPRSKAKSDEPQGIQQ
jgi:hypothetical protein